MSEPARHQELNVLRHRVSQLGSAYRKFMSYTRVGHGGPNASTTWEVPDWQMLELTKAFAPEEAARTELLESVNPIQKRVADLESELREARNEAATVRRAYLHERHRAAQGIVWLRIAGFVDVADGLADQAYRGASDGPCLGCDWVGCEAAGKALDSSGEKT